jgi:hypothetical protein
MKCFKLGMRRDWIMSEREREEKRKKIEENRRKKILDGTQIDLQQPSSNDNDSQYNEDSMNDSFFYANGPKPIRRRRRRRKFSGIGSPILLTCDNNNNKNISMAASKLSPMEIYQKMVTLPSSSTDINNQDSTENSFKIKHNPVNTYYSSSNPSYSSNSNNSYQSILNQLYSPSLQQNRTPMQHESFNNLLAVAAVNPQNHLNNSLSSTLTSNNSSKLPKNFYESSSFNTLANHLDSKDNFNTQKQIATAKLFVNGSANDLIKNDESSSYLNTIFDKLTASNSSLNNKNYDECEEYTDCDTPHQNDIETNYYKKSKIHKFLNRQNKKRKQQDPLDTKNDNNNNNNEDKNEDSFKHLQQDNSDENENNTPIDYRKKEPKSPIADNKNNETTIISQFSEYLLKNESSNLFSIKIPQLSYEKISSTTSMTDLQRIQVTAISEAYKRAIQLVKAQGSPKNFEDINTTINLTELGVRRIIFFFKLISDFRNLDHDLMVKLLKQNMMSMLQIHGVNSYNKEENTFKEPTTDDTPFSASSLVQVYGEEIYNFSISITKNLYDLCNNDMNYIKILMLILIFDPLNENLTNDEKKIVSNLQNKYVTLMYAYMRENLGSPKAELTFKGIIYEINKVNILANWFEKTVVEKSNYEYVRPLMKEIFSFPSGSTPTASSASSPADLSIKNSPRSVNELKSSQTTKNPRSYPEYIDKTPSTTSSFVSDTPHSNNSSYL